MNNNQKNLIFQFLEDMYEEERDTNQLFKKEKLVLKQLEELKEKYPESEELILDITDKITILNADVKYNYFEYGIIASGAVQTENINWGE